jgi:DNA polymerase-1
MGERIYLIDGSALVYRSHFAFIRNPLVTSTGENVSAVYGFAQTLFMVLREAAAQYAAVVFDTPEPTERHERYVAYKAQRPPMPEALVSQLPLIEELVRAVGIRNLTRPGTEADDLIASLAVTFVAQGGDAVIVSADKDFNPLLSEKIRQWVPPRGAQPAVWLGPKEVEERWGIPASRLLDLFALIGDTVDNVPGVAGIGEKTALELIRAYDDLDTLYERIDTVPRASIREKLLSHREDAFLSRDLIRLRTDLVSDVKLEEYAVPDIHERTGLLPLLLRLEFRRMVEQLGLKTQSTWEGRYDLIRDAAALREILSRHPGKGGGLSIVTAGTGSEPRSSRLLGIGFAWEPGRAYFAAVEAEGSSGIPPKDATALLGPLLTDPSIEKIGENLKSDLHRLRGIGIEPQGSLFDTRIVSYLIDPDRPRDLDAMALEILGHKKSALADLLGSGKQKVGIEGVAQGRLGDLVAEEADVALRLRDPLAVTLAERGQEKLYREIESPLIPVLAAMERTGVCCDPAQLKVLSIEMESDLARLTEEIHRFAGTEFNIGSPQQLGEILFTRLKLKRGKKTKTGWSTDSDVLEELAVDQPIARAVLEYRQAGKLRSTYVDVLPKLIDPVTGRIHAQFNQTVAATGRLSSSDPNLQNIPIRSPMGRRIRRAFVAQRSGDVLISADYSQIELRILAHLSEDEALVEAFRSGADIHAATAARIFDTTPDRVDPILRSRAKVVNYGILYGMGPTRLSREMSIPLIEARRFIEQYFAKMPRVRVYLDQNLARAKSDGYVSTILGRRRYLPELRSSDGRMRAQAERIAANAPIQGSAADLIKIAMIAIDAKLIDARLTTRLILQVHDELVLEGPEREREEVQALVSSEMEGAVALRVPLEVDVHSGGNWDEAHP